MWYNPPYSENVSTNIDVGFLIFLQEIFHLITNTKLFNRNNVKISYSCMPKIRTIIQVNNLGISNPPQT